MSLGPPLHVPYVPTADRGFPAVSFHGPRCAKLRPRLVLTLPPDSRVIGIPKGSARKERPSWSPPHPCGPRVATRTCCGQTCHRRATSRTRVSGIASRPPFAFSADQRCPDCDSRCSSWGQTRWGTLEKIIWPTTCCRRPLEDRGRPRTHGNAATPPRVCRPSSQQLCLLRGAPDLGERRRRCHRRRKSHLCRQSRRSSTGPLPGCARSKGLDGPSHSDAN
jgi:hypothetical protein